MALGLLFAILTGASWVAVGAVIGLAEKRGCGTARQQLVSQTITGTITATVLALGVALRPDSPTFSLRADIAPMLWTVLWGHLNYWMALCTGRAMRIGPNGTVWTIVQCGFIFPFVLGVAIGNTVLTPTRAIGCACVLAGVALCGRARTTGSCAPRTPAGTAAWLIPALGGFLLCGINQCAQCMASLGPAETRPTPLVRILCGASGVFAAILPHQLWLLAQRRRNHTPRDPDLGAKYRYLLKICGIGSAIFFLSSFYFLYNALDRLEAAGLISIATPTMLSACLVGFTIYGAVVLHERPSRPQLMGTAFALAGIALIAI